MNGVPSGRRLFETPWFAIEEIPSRPEWNMGGQPFYLLTGPDHVVIVPLTPEGKLVMVRQFRPARAALTLEFPAGGVEPGESPAMAALREFREETGYEAEQWLPIGSSGLANQRESATVHMFAALGARPRFDPSESGIEIVLATPEDLRRHILAGEMDMLVTLGVLSFAKAKLGPPAAGSVVIWGVGA
ncbi:MAG: NUDIX hydrolase [Alphaproteobacteria bacterium]